MRIEARNVSMEFNDAGRVVKVFNDLSLVVESGTSLAIVGQSGVGKTTLLSILGALECPMSGEVFWGEQNVTAFEREGKDVSVLRGKHVGFIFQFHHLFAEFDAVENVAMPLWISGMKRKTAREEATELLRRVGLGERLTHRPGALSGGEQQRVAIARALAAKPGLLLADEPTGNLDQKTGEDVRELLLSVQREFGVSLVIVTHSLELARRMNRIVELTGNGIREFQ